MLSPPRFHHIHLRSRDPRAAIEFYVRQFQTSRADTWAGHPALVSPNGAMILFDQTDNLPAQTAQSAIWHFGWHVTDCRKTVGEFASRNEVELLALYTGVEAQHVWLSSDTWFRSGDLLGVTRSAIKANIASGTPPPGGPGFAYFRGPDGALVEIAGDYPSERFNHVHMWQEDPLCAQLWYQEHLNASPRASYGALTATQDNCRVERTAERTFPALNQEGMYRAPRGGVTFGNVDLMWYPNQAQSPLVPSTGQMQDHIGLAVSDLESWIIKLRDERVTFIRESYALGDTRAVMIEGPSHETIELVEVQ